MFSFIAHTANILGSFNDPFEFQGDYGPEVNPVRQKVFELVVSKESFNKHCPDADNVNESRQSMVAAAIRNEQTQGPALGEVATPDLMNHLKEILNCDEIQSFIDKYSEKKIFRFLRNAPDGLLGVDKILRDKASREGKTFDLPILSSTIPCGSKKELMDKLFTKENLALAKPKELVLDENYLSQFFGPGADTKDLQVFHTPEGQLFFYWLYQALNLHLISGAGLTDEVNRVKEIFARTLGDPKVRAETFRQKLLAADSGVLFTQESDAFVPQALGGSFHPVDRQNANDGTFIFLRKELWEPDYQVIPLPSYEGYAKGRINLILATSRSGQKFLLVSAHGNSTRPEDGRLQITLAFNKYQELLQEHKNLQLLIGIDANTKTEEDVKALRDHLEALGLTATSVGPTTVKQRMVTIQHSKAGRFAVDEEDYLITLKNVSLTNQTVGFSPAKPDINLPLPNINNLSDHYPVGAAIN